VKAAALLLLFASAAALAAGEDRDPAAAVPKTDIRREALSLYKYEPHAGAPAPLPPFLAHETPPPPPSPSLIDAAPSDLRRPHMMNRLNEAIVQERADARAALVASRLGIGVSSVRVGRYFSVGAATAFYLPVEVGLSVIW